MFSIEEMWAIDLNILVCMLLLSFDFLLSTKEGTWTLKLRRAADFLTTLCFHNHFCCSLDYLIIPVGCHALSLWTFPILQGLGCGLPNHQVFKSIHTYSFLLCCSTWRSKGFPAIHVILIKYCYFTALCLIQKVCCGCRFRHLGFFTEYIYIPCYGYIIPQFFLLSILFSTFL
jgi:hypothetical protein